MPARGFRVLSDASPATVTTPVAALFARTTAVAVELRRAMSLQFSHAQLELLFVVRSRLTCTYGIPRVSSHLSAARLHGCADLKRAKQNAAAHACRRRC